MTINHPIYGQGIVICPASGAGFVIVQFKRPTRLRSAHKLVNCLAVSLRVCREL